MPHASLIVLQNQHPPKTHILENVPSTLSSQRIRVKWLRCETKHLSACCFVRGGVALTFEWKPLALCCGHTAPRICFCKSQAVIPQTWDGNMQLYCWNVRGEILLQVSEMGAHLSEPCEWAEFENSPLKSHVSVQDTFGKSYLLTFPTTNRKNPCQTSNYTSLRGHHVRNNIDRYSIHLSKQRNDELPHL